MVSKTTARGILMMALGCALATQSRAQLSGIKTVPGDYPDLASAITALNTQGVGSGGVVINLNLTATETAPVGGYQLGSATLNGSASATKTITINGNGSTITAYIGTTTADAMFSILGTDYVTINGLNLSESAANTTAAARMEWGYNLVKFGSVAPFDGCQNNVIQNCVVTLNAANTTTCGIRMAHSNVGSAAILPVTGATATDANSNNRFSGNTISNTDTAMCFRGMNLPGVYDYNNAVGGTNLSLGNTITVGGSTLANVAGVYTIFDSVLTVQYNQFSISSSQAAATTRLAMLATGTGRGDLIIRNNRFDITWNTGTTAFTGSIYAVQNDNLIGNAYPTTGHSDINAKFVFVNNMMTGTDTSATSGSLYGVYHNYVDWNIDSVCNNTFTNINWSSPSKTNSSGNVKCVYESGSNGVAGSHKYVTVKNNTFTNLYKNGTPGSGELTGVDNASNQATSGFMVITNNLMKNCFSNGSVKFTYTGNGVYANNSNINGQVVTHKYNKTDNVVAMTTSPYGSGIWANYVNYGAKGSEVAFDTVTNCRTNGGIVYGIYKSFNGDVHDCFIANDTSANGGIFAISNNASSNNNSIYNNRITGLTLTGTGSSVSTGGIIGINGMGGALNKCNIYNNSITDINAPLWGYANIYGMNVTANNFTTYYNIYYNTIKISTTSTGTHFGVAGIYFGDKVIGLDIRNNIINLNCTPNGQGIVSALVKQSSTNGSAPTPLISNTSGNNIYYVPSAPYCYYYAENFNIASLNVFGPLNDPNFNSSCLSTYKAWMGQKEKTSLAENNLSALSGYQGLYVPTGVSFAKSNCSPVSTPVITTDLLGVSRPAMADIGALQFTASTKDYFPPVISYTSLPATALCANVPPTLTTTINDASGVNTTTAAPRMYYRKSSETDAFGTNNTSAFNGWKYVTGVNTSGNTFTFTPNYSLLTSPIASGDNIVYFIIAQDLSSSAINVGTNNVAFASNFCPASVNLPAAAGPTQNTVAKNFYTVIPAGTPVLTPASATLCNGSVMITATGTATVPTIATFGTDSTFNSNSDDNSPLDGQLYNHRQQMIFTAAELTAQGMTAGVNISAVSLNVGLNFGVTFMDSLNIGLGNTTASTLTAGNWQPITPVFKGAVNVTNGVNTYVLNTPFSWDGTSNLVVDMISRKSAMLWSVGVINSTQASNLNMYYNDFGNSGSVLPYDTIIAHSVTNAATNVPNNVRPNMLFTYGKPTYMNWSPTTKLYKDAAMTIPMSATDTNSVVYAAPTVKTNYTVYNVLPGCNSAPSAPSVITPMAGFAQVLPSGNVVACDSITLHAPAASNITYQWQKNGVNIAGATDSVFQTTANGTYRVFVATAGCSDTATVAANVTVGTTPVAIISSTQTKACDSITLTANTGSGLNYQWQKNNVNIAGTNSAVYHATTSGNYSVVEITGAGCRDTSAVVTDTVDASPVPVITMNGNILTTTLLYATYQWNNNGQPISGATYNSYLITADGNYSVTVTNAAGCIGTSAVTAYTSAGISNVKGKSDISIYPNPTHDHIVVRTSGKNVNIIVRDLLGKVVASKADTKEINIGEVADGMYMVTITDEAGNILLNQKLLKQ